MLAAAAVISEIGATSGSSSPTPPTWHILATGRPYQELGTDFFPRRLDPERETRRLIAKLEALGHQVSLQPAA
jgi:hypothetical protein